MVTVHSLYRKVLECAAPLTREEAWLLMRGILGGDVPDLQLAALLGAFAAQPHNAGALAGFVEALQSAATPIPLEPGERDLLLDTCGTGADLSGTFNISTAAGLVAAAASAVPGTRGLMVAKHGNRAVTSACGSADVLQALGVPVDLSPRMAAETLRTHRFTFLMAPVLHPAMKVALPVRRALAVRTVFNLIGPLASPAGARAQVMGVYAAQLVPVTAEAMILLGVRHAFVVHGEISPDADSQASPHDSNAHPGMDELSISGPSHVAEIHKGELTLSRLSPEDLGLTTAPVEELRGGDAEENAAILRAIFSGQLGPRRDVVLLNAAAALVAADVAGVSGQGLAERLRSGMDLAARTIDSGAVSALLSRLHESNFSPTEPHHVP